jgi:hypothetical protein
MSALSLSIDRWRNITGEAYDFSLQYRYSFNEETQEITVEKRDDAVPKGFFSANSEIVCLTGKNGSGKSGIMSILNLTGKKLTRGLRIDNSANAIEYGFTYIFSHLNAIYVVKVTKGIVFGLWEAKRVSFDVTHSVLECKELTATPISSTWYYSSNNLQLSISARRITHHDLSIAHRRRVTSYAGPDEMLSYYQSIHYPEVKDKMASRIYTWRVRKSWYGTFGSAKSVIPQNKNFRDESRFVASLVALKLLWLIAYAYSKPTYFSRELSKNNPEMANNIPHPELLAQRINIAVLEETTLELIEEFSFLYAHFFSEDGYRLVKKLVYSQYKNKIPKNGAVQYRFSPDFANTEMFLKILSVMGQIKENVSESRFTVDPPFSTGEWKLIDLLSTLCRKAKEAADESTHIQFLLDEPDSDFHPDLQTRLIKIIVDLLAGYKDARFQLILSSHNPIVVSDLPSASVIPVNPGSMPLGKTFGSNIYELYKHRFFVDRSVGEFASSKIRDALENENITDDMLRFLIAETGEPILAYALKGKLKAKQVVSEKDIDQFVSQLTNEQWLTLKGKLDER